MSSPQREPEITELLRAAVSDSCSLPEDDVAVLAPFAEICSCERGHVVFREEQTPHSTFIVVEGEIELVYETPFERLVLQVMGPGSSIGYLAVVLSSPYAYSAVARSRATLLSFDRGTVERLIEAEPTVCFRWLRLVARNLERSQRRLIELAGKNAFERVAHFLINRSAERNSHTLEVTQRDIADSLALSRQTVSHAISLMRAQRLIDTERGHVRIIDLAGLHRHAPRAGD